MARLSKPNYFGGFIMSNHNLKEKMLGEFYEYSLPDIAEKLFMAVNTASKLERSGIIKIKQALLAKNINIKDLLP